MYSGGIGGGGAAAIEMIDRRHDELDQPVKSLRRATMHADRIVRIAHLRLAAKRWRANLPTNVAQMPASNMQIHRMNSAFGVSSTRVLAFGAADAKGATDAAIDQKRCDRMPAAPVLGRILLLLTVFTLALVVYWFRLRQFEQERRLRTAFLLRNSINRTIVFVSDSR